MGESMLGFFEFFWVALGGDHFVASKDEIDEKIKNAKNNKNSDTGFNNIVDIIFRITADGSAIFKNGIGDLSVDRFD